MDEQSHREGMMDNRIRARIEAWIDDTLPRVTDSRAGYDHVDYVLGEKISRSNGIETSLGAFSVLLQCVLERHASALPGLFIRLHSVDKGITLATPPNLQAIRQQRRAIEPPSLILYGLCYRMFVPVVEEYRCPLQFSLFKSPTSGVVAYYSESKNTDDDDYDRAIIVGYSR